MKRIFSILTAGILIAVPFFAKAAHLSGDPFAESGTSAVLQSLQSTTDIAGDPFATSFEEGSPVKEQDKEKRTWWQRWSFLHKGWLESRNRIRLIDGRIISARQRLWLEGGKSFYDNSLRFFVATSLDIDPAAASLSTDHDDIMLNLHEAYLTFERENTNIFLGRKMVRWGTGDGINPLDLINPLDQRDPLASGRSDNRLPVFLGQGIFSLPTPKKIQELTLELVAVPLAKVNKLSAAGSAWQPEALQKLYQAERQGILQLTEQETADNWFTDGKYAIRLTATAAGWDIALIGYSGVRNRPVFTHRLEKNDKAKITPEHPRMTAFGVNFAKGLERSTLRGELAIKPEYPLQKEAEKNALSGYRKENMLEGVIGFDHTFGLNCYINLQYFATCIPQYEQVVNHHYEHGMSYEISDLFLQDDLKLGISGIIGFSGQGWTMQPYGEYRLGDNMLLAASIFLFTGDKNGSYGQFDRRDFATLRLRWSF